MDQTLLSYLAKLTLWIDKQVRAKRRNKSSTKASLLISRWVRCLIPCLITWTILLISLVVYLDVTERSIHLFTRARNTRHSFIVKLLVWDTCWLYINGQGFFVKLTRFSLTGEWTVCTYLSFGGDFIKSTLNNQFFFLILIDCPSLIGMLTEQVAKHSALL